MGGQAEQVVEDQIALGTLRRVPVDHAVAGHAVPGRSCGGHAHVVALEGPAGDQGVAAPGPGVGHQELELAGLVAAAGQAGEIVPLHPEPARSEAQTLAEPVYPMERSTAGVQVDRGRHGSALITSSQIWKRGGAWFSSRIACRAAGIGPVRHEPSARATVEAAARAVKGVVLEALTELDTDPERAGLEVGVGQPSAVGPHVLEPLGDRSYISTNCS